MYLLGSILFAVFSANALFFYFNTGNPIENCVLLNLITSGILMNVSERVMFAEKIGAAGYLILTFTFISLSFLSVFGVLPASRSIAILGAIGFTSLEVFLYKRNSEVTSFNIINVLILRVASAFIGFSVVMYLMINGDWNWPLKSLL